MQSDRDALASSLIAGESHRLSRQTDLLFGALFILQWIGGVIAALWLAPKTWSGATGSVHIHVWAGLGLGSLLCLMPLVLIAFHRGKPVTRYTVAIAQMLFSSLLIHLSGGRIETHFHVFGSLAFLAFYRDWRVLVPATIVVALDHFVRGIFWPESVFGVLASSPWRAAEHAGWVVFEVVFLTTSCLQARGEMARSGYARADLELAHEETEHTVQVRTLALRERSAELAASEERLRLAVQGSQDGLWDWDLQANTVYYAPRWKELLGCAEYEIGSEPDEWLGRIASEHLARFDEALGFLCAGRSSELDTEIKMLHADGKYRWMLCRAISVRSDAGRVVRLAGSITDITELKEAQERLQQLAHHDRLTGLPNRDVYTERLDRAIARAESDGRYRFAVLYGDFDRFKNINDSLGHAAGDELLISIGKRFKKLLRDEDTVARFGGDEFVVLLDNTASHRHVEDVCRRLVSAFDEPHLIGGAHEVVSTLSLGVVHSGPEMRTADEMLRSADAAMYQAKTLGKGRFQVFDESMHAAAMERLDLENDLRAATRSEEAMDEQFRLLYQPIVSLSTGEIEGFEALVRWDRPSRGRIGPDAFIPIAEECGAITQLGAWTVRRACRRMAEWRSKVGPDRPLTMHVNLSRRQLVHPSLIDDLRDAMEETGVRRGDFNLELTETSLMDDRIDAIAIMRQIHELGIELAMDDFGTGQSSLSCLRQFPIKTLKVDRAFLRNMTLQREFSAVMHAIITLADNLNLLVIAEGIEDSGQLSQLQAMDCGYAQGFFFSRAVEAEEAGRMLENGFSFARNRAA